MREIDLAQATTTLTNCDREPIHIPGAILPHGAMLVLDASTLEVMQAAGDTMGLLGRPLAALLGATAETLFSAEQVVLLRRLCTETGLIKPRHLLDPILRIVADQPLDASAHRSDGLLVVEFEAADANDRYAADPLAAVQEMIEDFNTAPTIEALCQLAADRVRAVAGYDRVMVYRFMADASGWVIAEARDAAAPPFLGLHYPATDIPVQARALYLKSWLRLITKVDYDAAPLIPTLNPGTGKPLDMSHAILRDVSPVHREYLRNMGIGASMSISIIVEDRLWGLIACHHNSPRMLPRHLRAVCELFGSMFSLQLDACERSEQFNARLASRTVLQQLMVNLAGAEDYALGLTQQSPDLLDYIHGGGASADGTRRGGVAVRVDGAITFLGSTPNHAQISALTGWLTTHMAEYDGILATDRLGEIWAPAKAFADVASGLLVISVSREPSDFILWFRPELVETTLWSGDPTLAKQAADDGLTLSPRKSFAAWEHTVRGRALPWTAAETDAAFDLRVSLLEVVLRRIKAASRERQRAHERDKLLMAELDHRVKNTLANIQALVTQASRSAGSLMTFVKGLDGRIQSMAKAHSLLTQSRWEGLSIEGLLREELEPYGERGGSVKLIGVDVMLTPKSALALSLVVHELATNAAKFGAFSQQGGQLDVRWHRRDDRGVGLTWSESGGPQVVAPERRGFGSSLIERALVLETGGRATMRYDPDGVVCEIVMPAATVVETAFKPAIAAPRPALPAPAPVLVAVTVAATMEARPRILVVEDSVFVIMSLEAMFEDLGWQIVGPATQLADALQLAQTAQFDAALLDVNLDGEMSWPVAEALKTRGIPFAFGTGYDVATVLPANLAGSAIFSKPYRPPEIQRHIRAMLMSVAAPSDAD